LKLSRSRIRESERSLAYRLETLLGDGSIWRLKDLVAAGIPAAIVRRGVAAGTVEAVSRGVYRHPDAEFTRGQSFAEVVARVPHGVICLLSAAAYHGLTDEIPLAVWLGIPNNRQAPRAMWPAIRVVQWRNPAAFKVGLGREEICGVRVRITDPARTVVDMIRMRSTVGEDVAFESLRSYAAQGGSPRTLRSIADRMGLGRMMTPYVQVLPFMG
jgi:predicted transcriptional regulator of viral defense system